MAETVTVYRVECSRLECWGRGVGPYRGEHRCESGCEQLLRGCDCAHCVVYLRLCEHGYRTGHFSPMDDPGLERDPDDWERCGFGTLEQVAWWFDDETREMMAADRYVLNVYEVPADLVEPGQRQLLFAWDMAVLIEIQLLTSLNEGSAA